MNVDDPKLTAYALGELSPSERAEVKKSIADSSEAQRFVKETQGIAGMLKAGYTAEIPEESAAPANLIDIRDDPWFWSRARPLAIAAVIALVAILGAVIFGRHNLLYRSPANATDQAGDIQLENYDGDAEVSDPNTISNPLGADTIARAERVVIGQLSPDADAARSEIQPIEIISDASRVTALKNRLGTNRLSKTAGAKVLSRGYELIFLDKSGSVVAAASFYNVPGAGFVLQLSKNAYAADGRYFVGKETPVLPADWKVNIDYSRYIVPFPDWLECIGFSPGA